MLVIRRPARVCVVAAPPVAPVRVVPKLTPEEERERLVHRREIHRHHEVLGEFRAVGALLPGDGVKSARGQYRAGGDA